MIDDKWILMGILISVFLLACVGILLLSAVCIWTEKPPAFLVKTIWTLELVVLFTSILSIGLMLVNVTVMP